MDELYPGDIVSISKDHRSWGIRFLETEKMFHSRFVENEKFLVLEVLEQRVKVATLFGKESILIGTFYKSWIQKDKKFTKR